ncbi:MAG: hypothetical protein ACI8Q9_002429, partial [Planctomycetota bacterium]
DHAQLGILALAAVLVAGRTPVGVRLGIFEKHVLLETVE